MASYFDEIPGIVFERIIPPASENPPHERWTSKIPVDTICSLLRCTGNLSRVVKCMSSSLRYSKTKLWVDVYVTVVGEQRVLNPAILELLSGLGEGLEKLSIDDQWSKLSQMQFLCIVQSIEGCLCQGFCLRGVVSSEFCALVDHICSICPSTACTQAPNC